MGKIQRRLCRLNLRGYPQNVAIFGQDIYTTRVKESGVGADIRKAYLLAGTHHVGNKI